MLVGKDFHDKDTVARLFRRLGVHTSHIIPNTETHSEQIQKHQQKKNKEIK